MNLAYGLEGNIRIGNTFYEDHHKLVGACDYVMANPPFNVDGVQVAKVKSQVGEATAGCHLACPVWRRRPKAIW